MSQPQVPSSQLSAPPPAFGSRRRQEPRALVVALSALQLGLVLLVWVLAIVPAALLALGALLVRSLRGGGRPRVSAPPSLDR